MNFVNFTNMTKITIKLLFFTFVLVFSSCSNSKQLNGDSLDDNEEVWRVDDNYITEGGPFSLVQAHSFKSVDELIGVIGEYEKVLIINFDNEIRVYPYVYTNYSEVVNDIINQKSFAISFCPQTKSGLCFNSLVSGEKINFIASGFLYKENQVMSDPDLNLFWSQMLIEGIRGDYTYNSIETFFAIETNWKTVKEFFDDARVYINNNVVISGSSQNNSLNAKYFGVINNGVEDTAKLISYEYFDQMEIVEENINGKRTIIIGDKNKNFIVPFYAPIDLTFSTIDEFPIILVDNNGTKWDVFGNAVDGPDTGEKLDSPVFFVAELWAWKEFYNWEILL